MGGSFGDLAKNGKNQAVGHENDTWKDQSRW